MTRQRTNRRNRVNAQSPTSSCEDLEASTFAGQRGDDRLNRLAKLIASGEAQFSDAADADGQGLLVTLVGRKRRERLVTFIARAIALDIHRSREPNR